MAKLTTTNFESGEVTDRAATNTKFSAVQTATQTINEENVRSEGIDKRQLATHAYSSGRMEPIVHFDVANNLNSGAIVSSTYSGQNGSQEFELNGGANPDLVVDFTGLPGGHLAIASGDLIRIHYSICLSTQGDPQYFSAGDFKVGGQKAGNPADGIGLIIFPTWKLTGGGTHQVLTNEFDFMNNYGPGAGQTFNNSNARTESMSFISMEGAFPGNQRTGTSCERLVHGTWNHVATQAYTVYELRLYGRGPIVYQGDRQLYVPTWGSDRYQNDYMDIPSSGTTIDFAMSNGQLGIIVMRGDS